MPRLRSTLLVLFVSVLLAAPLRPVSAQSVDAVVENMRAKHEAQLQTVNTYIVETNLYTSYHKKVTENGQATYETETRMKGSDPAFASTTSRSSAYSLHFDRLKDHATYRGTETVNGTECHILQIDNPEKMDAAMGSQAESMTYYIDAQAYVPIRMLFNVKAQGNRSNGPQASTVTINMHDYRTVEGLTLPYRMEIQHEMNMSEQQKQQMQQMMKKMENLPPQQREQLKKMMGGDQMEMVKQMMSGDPVVVEVQDVQVNAPLPDDVF